MIGNITISTVIILGFIIGIRLMQSPKTAVWGNRLGAFSMASAIMFSLVNLGVINDFFLLFFIIFGGVLGVILGQVVEMIHMPQMVALLNGLGGAASALVAGSTAAIYTTEPWIFWFTAGLALAVGALTLSGSIVAALKLQGWIIQKPVTLSGHKLYQAFILVTGVLAIITLSITQITYFQIIMPLLIIMFTIYGLLMALRVGGADMPIVVSLLNSFSGIAAAICGLAVSNLLLVGVGALVGVAGIILTHIMCKNMNNSLTFVLAGFENNKASEKKKVTAKEELKEAEEKQEAISEDNEQQEISDLLESAEDVVIVPGYGMAVAQAQQAVKELIDLLIAKGKSVKAAIHPVAGRMPGHMNVLLAEVGIDYEMLYDLEEINGEFTDIDLAIVIGACDVINPEAEKAEGTPISGMPILQVEEARNVIVCNLDDKPGYSGVENSLYKQEHVVSLWGDAAETVPHLNTVLKGLESKESAGSKKENKEQEIPGLLESAEDVVIVPGYGMAVAQAQQAVKELIDLLIAEGKSVKAAIHPVAGRMPGHMNVLLAEVGIDYEMLYDLEEINGEFTDIDLAIVIGACDVINPEAEKAEGTPISGMPILQVEEARNVIVCNLDDKPGYSGVENSLYKQEHVISLWGDAAETVPYLIKSKTS
ncbi:NAD(P)(+) transhydrogenase (Re/Si-specific) subunit beta [Natroniella sp. ANB-PHB2]|uniref:NAD(P)(+) transhydrogenase (Re/Si-specific) subunit beta n=1 Tax=Natroniella sp. ANB-PHB2 TaxID=3384444 RepID=UPI0038D47756